jgi:hypothetical protein
MPTIKIPTAHLFVAIFVFFFATTASALNDLPQLSTIETAAIEYTENQGAVFITELITVEDTENDNIDGATITITGNYQAGSDFLDYTETNGISGFYNNGTLTLTNGASPADYTAALRAVKFRNDSDNPVTDSRTITFTVMGGNSVQRTINITAVNDLPSVSGITVSANEDQPVLFTQAHFTDAFTDVDGTLSKIRVETLPANGLLKLNGTNITVNQEIASASLSQITFEPNSNWFGNTSFTWNGSDGEAYATQNATVSITVNTVNDLPSVSEITVSANEDQPVLFTQANFTDAFTDVDGTLSKIRVETLPANGLLKLNGTNITINQEIASASLSQITFEPNSNWFGNTSFTWNGSDGEAYATQNATVSITVNTVNDLPSVSGITVSANEDQPVLFTQAHFTDAFTDVDGTLSKIRVETLPANGLLKLNGTNITVNQEIASASLSQITFEPNSNWFGNTSFTWNGSDGEAYATQNATVSITVNTVNDLPSVSGITVSANEDQPVLFTQAHFTDAFTDVDGTLSKIRVETLPANGLLKLNGTNITINQEIASASLSQITFEPNSNWFGNTSFTWNGSDGEAYATQNATVSITVNTVNDLPSVSGITVSANEDQPVLFTQAHFTDAFTDVDGTLSKIRVETLPANGLLKLNGTNITVNQEIASASLSQITFEPNSNWFGNTSFTWNGSDGEAYATQNATVSITVNTVNDLPSVSGITVSANEDQPVLFTQAHFTDAFTDVDGTLSKIRVETLPANGLLKLNGTNITINQEIASASLSQITFEPNSNWFGNTSFTWNGSDGEAYATQNATVSITVNTVIDLPSVSGITVSANEDQPVLFTQAHFTDAFTDVDGTLSKIRVETLPANGLLKLNGTNITVNQEIASASLSQITFEPNSNWFGNTSFTWNGSDGEAYATQNATVSITVNTVNDLPSVSGITVSANEDQPVLFTQAHFTDAFTDVDGTLSKIRVETLPANGLLKLNGTNITINQEIASASLSQITFEPNSNWFGNTSFTWNGSDGEAYATQNATVSITVNTVNDQPVLQGIVLSTNEDVVLPFTESNFTNAFSDIESSLSKIKIVTLPTNGTIKLGGTAIAENTEVSVGNLSTLTYTPTENWNGTDAFAWNGSDGTDYAIANASVTITVIAVNDAPTVSSFGVSGNEDVRLYISQANFLSHFSDLDGNTLSTIKFTELPQNGNLKLINSNIAENQEIAFGDIPNLNFAPDLNWNGSTTCKWTGSDGIVFASAPAELTLTIIAVNDLPSVSGITVSANEDQPVLFTQAHFTECIYRY